MFFRKKSKKSLQERLEIARKYVKSLRPELNTLMAGISDERDRVSAEYYAEIFFTYLARETVNLPDAEGYFGKAILEDSLLGSRLDEKRQLDFIYMWHDQLKHKEKQARRNGEHVLEILAGALFGEFKDYENKDQVKNALYKSTNQLIARLSLTSYLNYRLPVQESAENRKPEYFN